MVEYLFTIGPARVGQGLRRARRAPPGHTAERAVRAVMRGAEDERKGALYRSLYLK